MERKAQQIPFPEPAIIAGRNFWTKRAVRRWQAQIAGLPEPPALADDEVWLSSAQVRALFGGVSAMWLHRRRGRIAAHGNEAA